MKHKILIGDVLACLRTVPDCSVQCVVTSPPYLSSFGVQSTAPLAYLLDADRKIIIGEGTPAAVAAKVKDWEPVAPGRYHVVAGDDADPGALYEWGRFKARNQHWVIR